jgi:outer membrane protein OmpA-like peptidoglycan-associated protein
MGICPVGVGPSLSIRFYARNVLFAPGSAVLQPRFQTILGDFFPRYVRVLNRPEFRNIITELRIEGYTGTFWRDGATAQESYLGNMDLSQARTRSVLSYVLALPAIAPQEDWLMGVLTANGLSSSHLIRLSNGAEDPYASQRVEFRVRTNAEEQVRKLLALSATAAPKATANPILVVDDSIPPYPDWASPMIGKPLRGYFANTTSRCLGYLDDVVIKYTGAHPGAKIIGWGFDTTSNAPVARLVFADNNGVIIGAGEGGFQRPDVAARQPKIASTTTGWEGYVEVTTRPVAAWGIMSQPGTVCRFEPARPSGGESM